MAGHADQELETACSLSAHVESPVSSPPIFTINNYYLVLTFDQLLNSVMHQSLPATSDLLHRSAYIHSYPCSRIAITLNCSKCMGT